MEVQAQYPSTVAPFIPNYPSGKVSRAAGAGVPFFNINAAVAHLGSLPANFPHLQQTLADVGVVFSGEPESELTCNASGCRKRGFLEGSVAHPALQRDLQQQQKKIRLAYVPREVAAPPSEACVGTPSSLPLAAYDKIRMNESAIASTSARPHVESRLPLETAPTTSPFMEDLVSQLNQQSLEVEAFIRLQNESIRSGLEEARKRHHRALLSATEQSVLRRLREKEAELESASRRNTELEEKIRQLAAENQIWFNVARNNETIVCSLRATLEQVLVHNATPGGAAAAGPAILSARSSQEREEGFGESDCVEPAFPVEDAQSCCHEGPPATAPEVEKVTAAARQYPREMRLGGTCKACAKGEASVLLLPCRHVCLCKLCDSSIDACPVCDAPKNASLQVFMC
ncbi:hypothetical protein Taro_004232 [Colocasia esculenta]|uniref:RING-type domain-containing protein n=1 Tax=Colocasia esculenta TaxID=4460 RepID=A0A843TU72_COLES|nr:hypothetical protein [Colocasia esculenta]